ncbi:MAG: hypothetical protein IID33_12115, partial [Planctomycetes bacterium]|nr:hypothetical protein [Planctomycetota bacterium]
MLLLAATWRLWTPQTDFPQVPFILVTESLPSFLQWLGFGAMVAGLFCALLTTDTNRKPQAGLIMFSAAAVGMVLVDQHRLQ